MWTDHYLKFTDANQFEQSMPEHLVIEASETHATDIIGTLFHNATFAPLEGFHVNLRLRQGTPLPPQLEPFALPTPAYPKRVFA